MVPLVDALTEAVLRSNCRVTIAGMTGRADVADVFLQKLLLCVRGYGTNTGIRAVAAAGSHREHELYYLVRRYLTRSWCGLRRGVGSVLADLSGAPIPFDAPLHRSVSRR